MNASVAIQVLPSVQEEEEIIRIVDEVIDYIKSTGLHYYVGPCETAIEGMNTYVKISFKAEGDVLTIDKKVTKHHQ